EDLFLLLDQRGEQRDVRRDDRLLLAVCDREQHAAEARFLRQRVREGVCRRADCAHFSPPPSIRRWAISVMPRSYVPSWICCRSASMRASRTSGIWPMASRTRWSCKPSGESVTRSVRRPPRAPPAASLPFGPPAGALPPARVVEAACWR